MSSIHDSTPETAVPPVPNDTKLTLWHDHVEVLRARGISADFAIEHGVFSMDVGKLKADLQKYKKQSPWPHLPLYEGAKGIGIRYQECLDGVPRIRVRVDNTEVVISEHEGSHHGDRTVTIPRYICQARPVRVVPYIPDEVLAIAADTDEPVFLVEAPLKALSLTANGFPAVGLGGVLAGATDRNVFESLGEIVASPELQRIKWTGRTAYVVFDAGLADNPLVALGAARLALALHREGADVRLVQLPYFHPTETDLDRGVFHFKEDQGPDDYLARNGVARFKQLVDNAVSADPTTRVAVAAAMPNRTEAVSRLLGELSVQAVMHEGGPLLIDQVAAVTKTMGIGKKAVQQAATTFGERLQRSTASSHPGWKTKLRKTSAGAIMGSVSNALTIMKNDDKIKSALGYDELREEAAWVVPPPWASSSKWVERPVTDDDATHLVAWLDAEHDVRIPIPTAHSVIDAAARENPFHRVRDYLARVHHDGVDRVAGRDGPGWLTRYSGVEDSPYIRAVGRKFLVAAVARIRQPGCKLDTMLVLEGKQGKLKSTAVEVLFGADYFTDQLSDVTSKDASSDLRGKTAIEWSELDNLSRAESSAVKKYISRRVDDYRPAYGRRNVRVPRQCVFVGTTNKNTYLKDETGNRRFWPVTCVGEIKIDALKGDRDLLWAEAVALFEAGETWWFTSDDREASENAADEQEARRDGDPWEAVVSGALDAGEDITTDAEMNVVNVPRADENEVTTEYVLGHILGIPAAQQTRAQQSRVGAVMHALGWERRQRREGNRRVWVYVRLEPQPVTISDVSPPVTINSSCFKEDPEKSVSVLQSPSTEVGGAGGDGGDIVEKWPPNRVTTFSLAGGDGGDSVHVGAPLAAREANDPLDMV